MPSSLTAYKYRSGPAALRCLSEGTAYFAASHELNDSLEAQFDVADAEEHAGVVGRTLSDLSLRRGGPCFEFDQSEADGFRVENTRETERFVAACKQVGIYSCAARPDNQPMWAYYCNNARGVCFHLEWSKDVAERHHLYPAEVIYSPETRLVNRAAVLRQELLELANQNPTWSLDQLKAFSLSERFRRRLGVKGTAQAVSIKHKDWEHEQEIRMIAPRSGPLPLMKDILKSVIFTRTDFPEWGAIMMLLYQMYPDVQVAQMAFSHREPFVTTQLMTTKLVSKHVNYGT